MVVRNIKTDLKKDHENNTPVSSPENRTAGQQWKY
jgi:hypothetical protein